MALGIGIAAIRSDRHAADDSFGLVALCSIGPILAVLILGLIFETDGGAYSMSSITEVGELCRAGTAVFTRASRNILERSSVSLLPIVVFSSDYSSFFH